MTAIRALVGAVVGIAGIWTLADIPVVNPGPAIALGWVLVLAGVLTFTPALLDLLGEGE